MPQVIASIYEALRSAAEPAPAIVPPEPAVPIHASVKHDHLVCLEDGTKLTMLKRYLRVRYGMSPDEYRAKWGLTRDYPMVAPAYAESAARSLRR